MAYVMTAVQVPNASTAPVFVVPSGVASVAFWTSGTIPVFIGTSAAVSPSRGMQCATVPVSFENYMSSPGCTFYCANTSASTIPVYYSLVTSS